jgi:DNA-binding response OmpR family regulator
MHHLGMEAASMGEIIHAGDLEIRPDEFTVLANGRSIPLTPRELALLTALARRPNRIVSRAELYSAVWRRPFSGDNRSVDVYVGKLRQKLDEALPGQSFIHTHFGFGYRFAAEPVLQVFHNAATDR